MGDEKMINKTHHNPISIKYDYYAWQKLDEAEKLLLLNSSVEVDSPLSHLIAEHHGETIKISFIPDADTVSDGATAIPEIYTYEPKQQICH